MKPLICPQCGGKIVDYKPLQQFAVCDYCTTRFVIEPQKSATQTEFVYPPPTSPITGVKAFSIAIVAAVVLIVGGIILFSISARKQPEPNLNFGGYSRPYTTPISPPSPTPTPNLNLLEFGGEGTGDGLFQDADSIAVDKQGRIYVADGTMRVQQFDDKGNFLKLWQIPTETKFYKRARSIAKIGVDDKDRLFVLIDYGVVLVYENSSSEPNRIIHFAPNPIQDFAFRSDGGRVFLINGGDSEYLVQVTDAGKTVRRVNGFHSEAADASMSPPETGLAAIRIAVDGAGSIFSIYALGDLGTYQLSYNAEDFMIFRFTPEGKFVDKFVRTMNSVGIAVDNQSRVYISETGNIKIYSKDGKPLSTIPDLTGINAFALDKQNSIYIVLADRVIKRAAVQ